MKKRIFNPGFEFIFTLAILAVFGLPPLVMAQNSKDLQISINNGDTTINGKNIKDLPPKERQEALKDIGAIASIPADNKPHDNVRIKRMYRIQQDSAMAFNYHNVPDDRRMSMRPSPPDDRMRMRNPVFEFDRKNSQVFNFVTTDNNGVSTRATYRVSEPTDGLTHMGTDPDQKDQHEKLDMTDLGIVPQFSSGQTVIMFSLPSKVAADVQFEDSKGHLIWRAKALNGSFTKAFPLGLNGIYFLRVEQQGKLAVKKIFKEQM